MTVAHALPSERITNDGIVDRIREHNAHRFPTEEMAAIERRLRSYFAAAGTEVRYCLADGERAIDLVVRAAREALAQADVPPSDVDLLVYAGVARGWLEPAMATAVQAELGAGNATCFDVVDACGSWLRAVHVAHSHMRSGAYRRALIVNCESALYRRYAHWQLEDAAELDCRLATFTIGEAASATFLADEAPDDDFYFVFKSFGQHHALCMLPLPTMEEFLPAPADPRCVPGKFFTASRELLETATACIVEVFESDARLREGRYDICFGHAASERTARTIARRLGRPQEIHYSTHPRFGNTVSASVPLGMSLALEEGRLRRGDKVIVIIGSAGISIGFATFTF